jgi:hypothetical protein
VLVGKSGGKRPLGRSECRWKDTIIMDLRGIVSGLTIETSGISCKHGTLLSIKCPEFVNDSANLGF